MINGFDDPVTRNRKNPKLSEQYHNNNRGFNFLLWSHLGSNQGLPDYESGALTC